MMEGFDIRTLALTNILLGALLGLSSLIFSKIHSSFLSFRTLAYSYFFLSFGFILLSLRQFITDFFSIIVANIAIVAGFSLLIIGILSFLKYEKKLFIITSIIFLCGLLITFIHFTYVESSVNFRILIVSSITAVQSLYIAIKLFMHKEPSIVIFTRFLSFTFFTCVFISLFRAYFTINEPAIDNFMNAGLIHGLSIISIQLVAITSCFFLSLGASQQLAKDLAIQATIDSLTQVFNRRAFDDFAEKSVMRSQREKTPLSMIMMDIDLFKQVNDNYGHQVGDKVLQEFGLRLKNNLREYDVLARYGGEEFTILLPNTDEKRALIIAEKLRNEIALPVYCFEENKSLTITASFGVVTHQGKDIHWQRLISFADQALYHAKKKGRNRIMLYKDAQ